MTGTSPGLVMGPCLTGNCGAARELARWVTQLRSNWMTKRSAGILMYRVRGGEPQVLLVHPGGPYWVSKDEGAWSIPKGEHPTDEDPLAAAKREFEEETGLRPEGEFIPLGIF